MVLGLYYDYWQKFKDLVPYRRSYSRAIINRAGHGHPLCNALDPFPLGLIYVHFQCFEVRPLHYYTALHNYDNSDIQYCAATELCTVLVGLVDALVRHRPAPLLRLTWPPTSTNTGQ